MTNRTYEDMEKEVRDHFANISVEEFEIALKKASFEYFNQEDAFDAGSKLSKEERDIITTIKNKISVINEDYKKYLSTRAKIYLMYDEIAHLLTLVRQTHEILPLGVLTDIEQSYFKFADAVMTLNRSDEEAKSTTTEFIW